MHTQDHVAYACSISRMQAMTHIRRPRATLVKLFPKLDFHSLKGYIFHFKNPQVSLIFDWNLNWPWALKFNYPWGMGA